MKKITLLSVAIFMSSFLFAQWEVGPRIGVNFSTISGKWSTNDDAQHKWITGIVAGGFANYTVNEMFSVNGELLFINSGGKTIYNVYEDARSLNATEGYTIEKYNNLEIPVLFRFNFGDEIQFYAEVGPYFAYNLGGKYTIEIEAYNYNQEGKIKFGNAPDGYTGDDWYLTKEDYRRCDFGMYYGIGAQRKLGPGNISFDFRFGHGFIDTYNWSGVDDEGNEYEKPEGYKPYKNRNISLSFGYSIPLGTSN